MLTEAAPPPGSRTAPDAAAALAAAGLGAGVLALALLPAWRAEPERLAAAALVLTAAWMWAVARWMEARGPAWSVFFISTGALFRLALLLLHGPDLSDDVARYAWDGHLAIQGVNPYLHAPADPALLPYRTSWFGDINHKEIPTIYPPLAQAAFALAALVRPGTGAVRALFVLVDVALLVLTARLLARAQLPPGRLVIYAWSPLAMVEVASSGHVEPLGVLMLLLVPLALSARRPAAAASAWAGAVLSKGGPLLFAPLVWRWTRARGMLTGVLVLSTAVLPFVLMGPFLTPAVSAYATRWRGGEILFGPLLMLLEAVGFPPAQAERLARILAAMVVLLAALHVARRADTGAEPVSAFCGDAARLVAVAVLFSPVLHPWYLLWLLPLLCFVPSPPWLLLCGTAFLGYLSSPDPAMPLGGLLLDAARFGPAAGLWWWCCRRRGPALLPTFVDRGGGA